MSELHSENQKLSADAVRRENSNVITLLRSLWRQRRLLREMTRRELTDAHAGQAAGFVWLIAHPLLQFFVYAFLFSVVFQVRIAGRGPQDYLVYLFAGLPVWLVTQDVLARSSAIIIANSAIVKKVMFPIEVLVAKTVLASLTVQSILIAASVIYIFAVRAEILPIHAMLPVLIMLHLMIIWGCALLLSSITPFFRDVPEIVRILLSVAVYVMPILYLPDATPNGLKTVILLNPFSHLVFCYQDILYFNAFLHPWSWAVLLFMAGFSIVIGSYVFSRLRHYFSSVL